jgi:hypothetical protein
MKGIINGGMYQRLVIGEADAHVCVLDISHPNKEQPRKLTLESSRDDVIRPDRMITIGRHILKHSTAFGYIKNDDTGTRQSKRGER